MKFKHKMIHRVELGGCGGIFALINHKPTQGEQICANDFQHLDGTPVMEFDPMICESCGKYHKPDIRDFEE